MRVSIPWLASTRLHSMACCSPLVGIRRELDSMVGESNTTGAAAGRRTPCLVGEPVWAGSAAETDVPIEFHRAGLLSAQTPFFPPRNDFLRDLHT